MLGHVGVYSLTITAQNSGGAKETGSAKVVVNVEDFNDNTPELRVLNNRSTTVHRPEVWAVQHFVSTLVAMTGNSGPCFK